MKMHLVLLGLILIIGLFFRTYEVVERFEFAHDGDLYSWIVKDVLVNHHFRLIGQLTSAPGIFIGPLFYYLLIPFFVLTKMDPIGAIFPVTILGLFTIFSYYLVLSKLFNKQAGLIAAFLYAVLITTVNTDRWIVPTVTTSVWAIWYLYTLVLMARGKFSVLPFLGILIGLIWSIHIALIPSLIAIPAGLFVSRKVPNLKQITLFFGILIITLSPLILFELRHNFQQTFALIKNFTDPVEGSGGFDKFIRVLDMNVKNINALFFAPQSFEFTQNVFFLILILLLPLILIQRKLFSLKDFLPLYGWVLGIVLFFSISSSPISEYYFSNLNVIFITFVSIVLASVVGRRKIFLWIVVGGLIFIFLKDAQFLVAQDYYHKGYLERKGIVNFIARDAAKSGFPCVGISYITAPGENVGFRYFFWLKKMHLVHPSLNVPVYNIVLPDELSKDEVKEKFGHIGIIPPAKIPSKEVIEKSCQTADTNLTDSVFGYVE